MDLADAIDRITSMARKSAEPVLLDLPENPTEAVYVIDGQIKTLELDPTPRNHHVDTLRNIIAAANRFYDDDAKDAAPKEGPSVWTDERAVTLVIDDNDHRASRFTFPLHYSDQFQTLIKLAEQKPKFQQKPFVRLLRVDLAGCFGDSILLNQIRKLKFENSSIVSGEVKHARESMGREINSKVETTGELPEEVVVTVPVYRNRGEVGFTQTLRCALEIDASLGEFQLTPFPGEIQRLKDAALADIEDRLGAGLTEGIHLYNGRP